MKNGRTKTGGIASDYIEAGRDPDLPRPTPRGISAAITRALKAARNPLRNPKIGDRVKDRYGHECVLRPLGPGESFDVRLWRKAMKGGTVLHVAD